MTSNLLIIYSKWPNKNDSKRRIAQSTSPSFAEGFSIASLKDLINNVRSEKYDLKLFTSGRLNAKKFLEYYGVNSESVSLFGKKGNSQKVQSRKFQKIFSSSLKKYEKVILIPMDVPYLKKEFVIKIFRKLDKYNFILGPENNGGVYLVGMAGPYQNIFQGVRWSSQNSLMDLRKNLREKGHILISKDDLNDIFDIIKLKKEIRDYCPNLYKFILKNLEINQKLEELWRKSL